MARAPGYAHTIDHTPFRPNYDVEWGANLCSFCDFVHYDGGYSADCVACGPRDSCRSCCSRNRRERCHNFCRSCFANIPTTSYMHATVPGAYPTVVPAPSVVNCRFCNWFSVDKNCYAACACCGIRSCCRECERKSTLTLDEHVVCRMCIAPFRYLTLKVQFEMPEHATAFFLAVREKVPCRLLGSVVEFVRWNAYTPRKKMFRVISWGIETSGVEPILYVEPLPPK